MNINNRSDETERKITRYSRPFKPKPIQEMRRDRAFLRRHAEVFGEIGENRPTRFTNITDVPGGIQAVETVVGSHKKRGMKMLV